MIPGFGGGLGKWVWEKVWGGLGGWSGRPYVAIPGFGGGGLGGGSGETVCSDSWVWLDWAGQGCAELGWAGLLSRAELSRAGLS